METHAALVNAGPTANAPATIVVRYGSETVRQDDLTVLALMFPHLFPFGSCLADARRTRVSLEATIRHLLKLSSRRFASDPHFTLVCFDICGKRNVAQAARNCVTAAAVDSAQLVDVSPDALKLALDYQERRRRGSLELPPAGTSGASMLISASSTVSSAFPGSNEARYNCRRQIFSSTYLLGPAPFFVTLSPCDYRSVAVTILSGKGGYPPQQERFQCVADNATAPAMYFDIVMARFIDVVLNYDVVLRAPRATPGLLGYVQAYYWMVECQGRGTLHAHGLIWTLGRWSTVSAIETLLNDSLALDGLSAFLGQLITCEIALLPSEILCPTAACTGSAVNFGFVGANVESRHKPGRQGTTPEARLAQCNVCNVQHTCSEIYATSLRKIIGSDYDWIINDAEESDRYLETPLQPCTADSSPLDRAKSTLKTLLVNKHDYLHRASCFKSKKRGCRFGFPQPPCDKATSFSKKAVADPAEHLPAAEILASMPAVNLIEDLNRKLKRSCDLG